MMPLPKTCSSLLCAMALVACRGSAAPTRATSGSASAPGREEVRARLEATLHADPNSAMCQSITSRFAAGDEDALRDIFDFKSFVARIGSYGHLPPEISASLAARTTRAGFSRLQFPKGSQFLCLGTRTYQGQPHIALRQWTSDRFDYVLLHVASSTTVDDYIVVSQGTYHSEDDALYFLPEFQASMKVVSRMLELSYKEGFAEIIRSYRTLPAELQASPLAFSYFVNAVFSTDTTDTPLYREALAKMNEVFRERPYALAYWTYQDGLPARRLRAPSSRPVTVAGAAGRLRAPRALAAR
jgi:hypothetical protein